MLTLNLKKEWFEKIKSGEKTHEYREVKPYWTNRFMKSLYGDFVDNDGYFICMCNGGNPYIKPLFPEITFCNGYPKSNDKNKRIKALLKRISIINGVETDLRINRPVYVIEFELIKSLNQNKP